MTAIIATQDARQTAVQTVLDAVTSENTRRAYARALTSFLDWHSSVGQPALTKAAVNSYKAHLQSEGKTPAVINQSLCAIRKLVREAADNGAIEHSDAAAITSVKGIKSENLPAGRNIESGELSALLATCSNDTTPAGARDAAMIAVLYAGGLRRGELVKLDVSDFDPATGELRIREAKGRKQRNLFVENGTQAALEDWLTIRGSEAGPLFCQIRRGGNIWQDYRLTTQAVYHVLQTRAKQAGVTDVSPHDFRRTFVGDLLDAGADIATVQKMAGHADVNTTARYDRRGDRAKQKAAGLLHVPYKRKA